MAWDDGGVYVNDPEEPPARRGEAAEWSRKAHDLEYKLAAAEKERDEFKELLRQAHEDAITGALEKRWGDAAVDVLTAAEQREKRLRERAVRAEVRVIDLSERAHQAHFSKYENEPTQPWAPFMEDCSHPTCAASNIVVREFRAEEQKAIAAALAEGREEKA